MDESDVLIARAALAAPDVAAEAWAQWKATHEIGQASALLSWAGGYINRNLLAAGVTDPYLGGIHRYNWLSNNRKVVAASDIVLELANRFTITPLKSFGMSEDTYSRGLRPLADFDFYVPVRHVAEVEELLRGRGYHALLDASTQEFRRRIVPQRGSWNFLNTQKVDIDVHWRLLDHLDTGLSERLVAERSTTVQSEFGPIRRLDAELMAVCLAAHHALQPAGPLNIIFDFCHLLASANVSDVAALAARVGIARELSELCQRITELLGSDVIPQLTELEEAARPAAHAQPAPSTITEVPVFFEPLPERYFEPWYLNSPTLYRLWFALGRPLWLERALMRRFGTVSRTGATRAEGDQYPAESGELTTGWHFRYPWEGFRWAVIPDARVVFTEVPSHCAVRIEFDPESNRVRPAEVVEVFANGRYLGHCERTVDSYEFALPPGTGLVELSLRLGGAGRFRTPGMYADWYRMLAPVSSIRLVSLDPAGS